MTSSVTNPKVDRYLAQAERWREEMVELRRINLDSGLSEDLKWGKPCYTLQGSNIDITQAFKDYVAIGFFKGTLLKDPENLLVSPGEHSQAMRQIRFTSVQEVIEMEPTVRAYIAEAIEIEKAGLEVEFKEKSELIYPDELESKFQEDPALQTAFAALTPGRQRAYVMHFSAPKQSSTRTSRIEKSRKDILNGKGLNDR